MVNGTVCNHVAMTRIFGDYVGQRTTSWIDGYFVGDILCVAQDGLLQACFDSIAQLWTCSKPEYVSKQGPVRLCGLDIYKEDFRFLVR